MNNICFGEPLKYSPGDLSLLLRLVVERKLIAKEVDVQSDGDTRYWGVDVSQNIILQRLKDFSELHFTQKKGKPPRLSITMVNFIDAQKSPGGSGGGWHRDSFRAQYKGFVYLTDVLNESQGAFSFILASNSLFFKLVSVLHKIATGKNRYSDKLINPILRLGFSKSVVLLESGYPFFVDTSLIHRGLPITEGRRIMASIYMFEDMPEQFIKWT